MQFWLTKHGEALNSSNRFGKGYQYSQVIPGSFKNGKHFFNGVFSSSTCFYGKPRLSIYSLSLKPSFVVMNKTVQDTEVGYQINAHAHLFDIISSLSPYWTRTSNLNDGGASSFNHCYWGADR